MLHPATFSYLQPTPDQAKTMGELRDAFAELGGKLTQLVPDGPDRTYLLRHLRECAMWANVAVTRYADGKPRALGPQKEDAST